MNLLYERESYQFLGACFEVYKEKGSGFLEAVYQECLGIEFALQQIPHLPKPQLEMSYKGRPLIQRYSPDFICFGLIVVELKASTSLCDEHRAQLHNYLRATGLRLGFLMNFGHYPKLEYERVIL